MGTTPGYSVGFSGRFIATETVVEANQCDVLPDVLQVFLNVRALSGKHKFALFCQTSKPIDEPKIRKCNLIDVRLL